MNPRLQKVRCKDMTASHDVIVIMHVLVHAPNNQDVQEFIRSYESNTKVQKVKCKEITVS